LPLTLVEVIGSLTFNPLLSRVHSHADNGINDDCVFFKSIMHHVREYIEGAAAHIIITHLVSRSSTDYTECLFDIIMKSSAKPFLLSIVVVNGVLDIVYSPWVDKNPVSFFHSRRKLSFTSSQLSCSSGFVEAIRLRTIFLCSSGMSILTASALIFLTKERLFMSSIKSLSLLSATVIVNCFMIKIKFLFGYKCNKNIGYEQRVLIAPSSPKSQNTIPILLKTETPVEYLTFIK